LDNWHNFSYNYIDNEYTLDSILYNGFIVEYHDNGQFRKEEKVNSKGQNDIPIWVEQGNITYQWKDD